MSNHLLARPESLPQSMHRLLTDDEFDASEALQIGLAHQVVPADTSADVAHIITETMCICLRKV